MKNANDILIPPSWRHVKFFEKMKDIIEEKHKFKMNSCKNRCMGAGTLQRLGAFQVLGSFRFWSFVFMNIHS